MRQNINRKTVTQNDFDDGRSTRRAKLKGVRQRERTTLTRFVSRGCVGQDDLAETLAK